MVAAVSDAYRASHAKGQGTRVSDTDLLKELRIERHQREDHGTGSPRWPWLVGVLVVLVLVAAGGWWWWGHRAMPVQVAMAVAPSSDADAGAVT